jgi:hypothetical protein
MNIFIWESYDNIQVFETETNEDIRKLLHRMMSIVDDWCEDAGYEVKNEIKNLFHVLDTNPNAIRVEIQKFFNHYSEHVEFFYGRFSKTIPL